MFYSIALTKQENYSNFYQLGLFSISTDSGWHQDGNMLYKGYADDCCLSDNLELLSADKNPSATGNYTILKLEHNTLHIYTDKYRSYPLYVDDCQITNLEPSSRCIWADSVITVNKDLSVVEEKINLVGNIDTSPLTFEQALALVDQLLNKKTYNFLQHNRLPINAFLSGGMDSLLVYSYLVNHTAHFDLIKGTRFDYDNFWIKNSNAITKNYWGYKQLHHWNDPCVLTSGTPGDEFMLRGPQTVTWLLQNAGYIVPELITNTKYNSAMQFSYFNLPKNLEIFNQPAGAIVPHKYLIHRICNNVVNDFQHWHLGNTLTWTPLRDLEITKTMLRVPAADLVGQIMDSTFSRALVEKNSPHLSHCVSSQKNTGNILENLYNLYNGIV